jgi:uncharacterized heparinase superfamily protein
VDGSWSLPEAGYYGFRDGGDYFISDCGVIGPDYQPGHAHADFLSFELSLGGQRVITDTGVGTYEVGPQRSYERSTAAHSTVEIAGDNSIEVWGGFRVGRRTKPEVLRWEPSREGCFLEAEHYGYSHLPGRPMHRRSFFWRDGLLVIHDRVSGAQNQLVVSRLHLAPGVLVRVVNRQVDCRIGKLRFTIEVDGPGEIVVETTEAYPRFGIAAKRKVIAIRTELSPPGFEWKYVFRKI